MTWAIGFLFSSIGWAGVDLGPIIARLTPGQTFVIPDGDYPGFVLTGVAFAPPVTLRARAPGKVVIHDRADTRQACWLQRCSGIRMEGLTFVSQGAHALHVDGVPLPDPVLSSNLEFNDCVFVSLGDHYCAKLSQARLLVFDRSTFLVPERARVKDHLGGGLDAVAVDEMVIRYCRFDVRRAGACTLMVKGGSRNIVVRDNEFDCPGEATFFLAGPTDPAFRVHAVARHELENLTFQNNTVRFASSSGTNVHGTWDSLANGRFRDNRFFGVGQILFVAKRSQADLAACAAIEFSGNEIELRPAGLASPYNAVITTQTESTSAGEVPLLPPDEFRARDNVVRVPGPTLPEITPYLKSGFRIERPAVSSSR